MIIRIFLIITCLFLPFAVYGSVIINEVAWMGTEVGSRDEWIELRNMTNRDIDLSGWVIENASKNHGSLEIPQDGKHIILSNSYYLISYYSKADNLLEPKTALDVIVDWRVKNMGVISFANNYNNNGQLRLKDDYGTLIDQTPSPADNNWPAGDNSTKQTMERTDSGNWQNSQEPNGTPKTENSIREEPPTQSEPEPESEPETGPASPSQGGPLIAEAISYPAGIIFNEILPSPEGPDVENEWIELYNKNDFEVDLSEWTVKDTAGSTKTYTLNIKISKYGYLLLKRPETKITLNNSGEGLNLVNPNGDVVDSVNFGKASLGQSYSKTLSDWTWNSNLTPGEKNIIPIKKSPSPAKTIEKELPESGSRAIESVDIDLSTQKSKPPVWLTALVVAIFSAIVLLVVKNSLF